MSELKWKLVSRGKIRMAEKCQLIYHYPLMFASSSAIEGAYNESIVTNGLSLRGFEIKGHTLEITKKQNANPMNFRILRFPKL